MRTLVDVVERLLRELIAEVRGLRADLASRRHVAPDSAFLGTLSVMFGATTFTAADVCLRAAADPELGRVIGPLTARQIGKRLRAATGQVVGRFVVRRVGRDDRGTLWEVLVL